MNISAKVIKKDSAASVFTPFSLPEIGAGKTLLAEAEATRFAFPAPFEAEPIIANSPEEIVPAPSIEDILQTARDEAAQIIAQAEEQKELIEQAMRDEITHTIRAELRAEMSSEVDNFRHELASTIEQISALHPEITARAETDLVELAFEIAKKIVGREITLDREVALTLAKIALSKLHNRTFARVHLNPDDFAYLQTQRDRFNFHGSLELVEDRSISQGGCLIQTDTGEIDARIESQLDEISYGLLGN
jgi:flagellar assembly protein FliH